MWDGLLHLIPPPGPDHQQLAAGFLAALAPAVHAAGLRHLPIPRLFRAASDYRVPDLACFRPGQVSDRGLEGAEVVVEICRSDDEFVDKLDFYGRLGVPEVVALHPRPRRVELFIERGGRMLPVQSDSGRLHSDELGVWLHVEDDELVVSWDVGSARI